MKTRTWILIFASILLLSALACVLLFRGGGAAIAEIWVDGVLRETVDLRIDRSFTVESERGSNTVEVRDGTIRVTEASCPDHICISRGACDGGAPIICLPNRLVIRFTGSGGTDATVG